MGRAKKRPGSPACFLSAILSLLASPPFSRGCRRIWRGELSFIGFGGATLLDRIGPPGRCSGGWPHDRNSWLIPRVNPPRVNPFYHPYARARARQWSARCYGVARQRDGSRQKAAGVSGVLSLRHSFPTRLSSVLAWVPKNLARRVKLYWFRRRDAARPDRAAWAVQRRLAARSQQLVDTPR